MQQSQQAEAMMFMHESQEMNRPRNERRKNAIQREAQERAEPIMHQLEDEFIWIEPVGNALFVGSML